MSCGIRITGMAHEEIEQESETMDKNTCYCTTKLNKLVHQVPLFGGVLASI